jgi:hypothetical protein
MMRFQLEDLHAVALNAFDEMESVAVRAMSDTTEFNERQFVFQLAALLTRGVITQGAPLWTGFEYRYPGNGVTRPRTKCDLAVWEQHGQGGGTMGWLEVKSTGLDENGNWDNSFGNLGWREDFEKLKGITEQSWNMQHLRAWIWLYQFENYRQQVDEAFGTEPCWSPPVCPLSNLNHFGTPISGRVNLPRVLLEIAGASSSALMSVRPRVRVGRQHKVFSALILTAMVARESQAAMGAGATT